METIAELKATAVVEHESVAWFDLEGISAVVGWVGVCRVGIGVLCCAGLPGVSTLSTLDVVGGHPDDDFAVVGAGEGKAVEVEVTDGAFVEAWVVGGSGLRGSDGAVRGGSDAERCVVAEGDGGGGGADAENDAAVERWRFVDFARLPYSGRSSELIKLGEFGGVVSHVRGGIATLSAVVMEVVASCWEALDGTSTPSVFSY